MSDARLEPPPPRSILGLPVRVVLCGLAAALALLVCWNSIFVAIGSGRAGVLWSRFGGGTVMDHTFGEGVAVIWPWNAMAVYDVRLQEMHDTVRALTSDGLQVRLDVTTRFAPRATDLPTLHRMVGPRYRATVVRPDTIAAVRHVVRQFVAEDLRVIGEAGLSGKVEEAARSSVGEHWVDLDRVLITRIALPQRVEAQVEARLAEEQKALAGPSILRQAETERQRRLIEADGVRDFEARAQVSILKWRGLEALERLAASPNAKLVVLGTTQGQVPIVLDPERVGGPASTAAGQVGLARGERLEAEGVKEKAEAQHQH